MSESMNKDGADASDGASAVPSAPASPDPRHSPDNAADGEPGRPESGQQGVADDMPEGEGHPNADWRDLVEDQDLKRQLDRYESVEDLARHNLALRRRLSRSITPPGDDADTEELAAFRARMGVPESPEDYDYEAPDDLPEELAAFAGDDELAEIFELAHGLSLTQDQLSSLLDWRYEKLAGTGERLAEELGRRRAEAETALQREWGRDYRRNLHLSQRALREYGGEGLSSFLARARVEGTQLANHPEIVRWAANAGRALAEASLRQGGEGGGLSAEERRSELTRAIHDARAAGDTARARELDAERRALTGQIYRGT
jgi:hypothetical protein